MRVCVFIIFGKNAGSISACSNVLQKVVSQQSELCVFRCAASAAHFYFIKGCNLSIMHNVLLNSAVLIFAGIFAFLFLRSPKYKCPTGCRFLSWILFVVPFAMGGFYSFVCLPVSIALLTNLFRIFAKYRTICFEKSIATLGLVTLFLSSILSILWAVDKGMSTMGILRTLPIILYALNIMQISRSERVKLINCVPVSAIVMTVISFTVSLIPSFSDTVLVAGRLAGFFGYPNTFGLFLLVGFILSVYHYSGIVRIVFCGILSSGIVMSGSRAVFVLFLLASMAILLLKWNEGWKKTVVLIASVFVCVLITYFLSLIGNADSELTRLVAISPKSSTFLGRILYAKDGLIQTFRYPFGMGYGGFRASQGSFQTAYYTVSYSHNSVLQLILDYGWIPTVLISLAILKSFYKSHREMKLLILTVLLHSIFDFNGEFLAIWMLLLPMIHLEGKKQMTMEGKRGTAIVLCLSVAVSAWLSVGDFLFVTGKRNQCLSIMPFHTQALEWRLTELSEVDELDNTADRVLSINNYSSIAYSAKANVAYSRGKIGDMIRWKCQAISCSKYSMEEYIDYFDKVYEAYQYYCFVGDYQSAEICKQRILEIPELLSDVADSSSSIAARLSDQPEMKLPEKYLMIIEELQTT